MYDWRRMSAEQRNEVLEHRQRQRLPWHGPPHYSSDSDYYLITAACFEHRPHIGHTPERLAEFEAELLQSAEKQRHQIFGWIVLPNHYHLLLNARSLEALLRALKLLHGRTAHRWNGEDQRRGRQVWHRVAETVIKSEGHFIATLKYLLHNAIRHGYVDRWQDWPYSSADQYLSEIGREEAEDRWRKYPVLDYGNNWDPPEM